MYAMLSSTFINKIVMNKNKRIYSLDILKLLLCAIIVCHHFQQITETRFKIFNFYGGIFRFGTCADLFFVISGFVCALSYTKAESFYKYIDKKVKRVFPMAFYSTLFLIIVDVIVFAITGHFVNSSDINLWKICKDLTLSFCWFGNYKGLEINNPLWYVSVLLVCYCLYWVISKLCEKCNDKYYVITLFFIVCFLSCRYLDIDFPFINDLCCRGYVPFLVGSFLYKIYEFVDFRKIMIVSFFSLSSIVFLALLSFSIFIDCGSLDRWAIFVFCIFPPLIFIVIWINRFIPERIVEKLNLSNMYYTVYCWHYPFIVILRIIEIATNKKGLFDGNYSMFFMLMFVIIAFVLAKIINVIYEKLRVII